MPGKREVHSRKGIQHEKELKEVIISKRFVEFVSPAFLPGLNIIFGSPMKDASRLENPVYYRERTPGRQTISDE